MGKILKGIGVIIGLFIFLALLGAMFGSDESTTATVSTNIDTKTAYTQDGKNFVSKERMEENIKYGYAKSSDYKEIQVPLNTVVLGASFVPDETSNRGEKAKQAPAQSSTPEQKTTTSTTGAATPQTVIDSFAHQEITIESVLDELNGIKDDSYSIDLTGLNTPRTYGTSDDMGRIDAIYPCGGVDGYCVNVWCPPRNYLSSYNVLEVAAGTTVEVVQRLFTNPNIDYIRVMQQMDIGLDDPIKAVQIEVDRETYEGTDWDEAKEQIKNNAENAFEIFGPCNVYTKGSSGYNRPARYECNN